MSKQPNQHKLVNSSQPQKGNTTSHIILSPVQVQETNSEELRDVDSDDDSYLDAPHETRGHPAAGPIKHLDVNGPSEFYPTHSAVKEIEIDAFDTG